MAPSIRAVIYPVTDLAKAKAVFGAILGTAPVMDESYYVRSTPTSRRSAWIRTAPARA